MHRSQRFFTAALGFLAGVVSAGWLLVATPAAARSDRLPLAGQYQLQTHLTESGLVDASLLDTESGNVYHRVFKDGDNKWELWINGEFDR